MVFWEANDCFLTVEIVLFTIALFIMGLICSGFEHLGSEWIFSMYPPGRHLSNSKVSFDTAARSHL